MAWYRAGTVSVTASSTTVTGTGTAFVANARVGDAFIGPDGRLYEVSNVASDTAISILPEYIGASASVQSYAIAPVQGYTKKLADEAAALINDFSQLGDLGTAAGLDAVTSSTDTTADRLLKVGAGHQQLDPDLYRKGNIVGTVSQSGGVPTGAIIQRGSNANGEFIRFADGTMISFRASISANTGTVGVANIFGVTAGNMYGLSGGSNYTFPAAFSGVPNVSLQNGEINNSYGFQGFSRNVTTTSFNHFPLRSVPSESFLFGYIAIGRWF